VVRERQGTIFNLRGTEIPRAPRMAMELASQRGFDGDVEDRRRMIKALDRWNEEVKQFVPARRLLESV
jgi:hypothetical protein